MKEYYWVKLAPDMPWEIAVYADQYPGFFVTGQADMFHAEDIEVGAQVHIINKPGKHEAV